MNPPPAPRSAGREVRRCSRAVERPGLDAASHLFVPAGLSGSGAPAPVEEDMTFCIPILENRGLLSPVSPHFGAAPMYLIVDGATLAHRSVPNPVGEPGPRCGVPAALAAHGIDAYIVGGIGDHALAEISRASAPVYRAGRGLVADALAEQIAGRLPLVREGTRGPGWQLG